MGERLTNLGWLNKCLGVAIIALISRDILTEQEVQSTKDYEELFNLLENKVIK